MLALPGMANPPGDAYALEKLLIRYETIVRDLSERGATDALRALADSGRRWLVIVELTVPADERFSVKRSEDRPIELHGSQRSRQRFALGDAGRAHLEIRLADPNIHLEGEPICRDPLQARPRATAVLTTGLLWCTVLARLVSTGVALPSWLF